MFKIQKEFLPIVKLGIMCQKSIQNPVFYFAKLRQLQSTLDQTNYESVRDYYEDLVRMTPSSENGLQKFSSMHLEKMIKNSKNIADIEFTIQAYINFLGHFTKFQNSTIDSMFYKAINLNYTDKLQEILQYSNYLAYYPHPDVILQLMNQQIDQQNIDYIKQLFEILKDARFIKSNNLTYQILVDFMFKQQQYDFILEDVVRVLERKNIKIEKQQIQNICLSIVNLEEIKSDNVELYESILKYIDQTYVSNQDEQLPMGIIISMGRAFIKLNDVDKSIKIYQKLSQKQNNLENEDSEQKSILISDLKTLVEANKEEKSYLNSIKIE